MTFYWGCSRTVFLISVFSSLKDCQISVSLRMLFSRVAVHLLQMNLERLEEERKCLAFFLKRDGGPQENLLPSCFEMMAYVHTHNPATFQWHYYDGKNSCIQKLRNARIITTYFLGGVLSVS